MPTAGTRRWLNGSRANNAEAVEQRGLRRAFNPRFAGFDSRDGLYELLFREQVRPTYIENWPAALCRLSIAQAGLNITVADAHALGTNIIEWSQTFGPPQDISAIRAQVAGLVNKFPSGAFVRLGSRSPKDAWGFRETKGKVLTGEDPFKCLLDCSERISDDLHLAVSQNYSPWIWARQWFDIPEWSEFRCFMRAGHLVGISQYFYRDSYEDICTDPEYPPWAIGQFFPFFAAASHLQDVVFDVFLICRPRGPQARAVEVKLLEINPFFEMTDPCLFDWRRGGDFDYDFRFIGPDGKVADVPL